MITFNGKQTISPWSYWRRATAYGEEFDDSTPDAYAIGHPSDKYSLSRQATARYVGERSKQCCAIAISRRAKRSNALMPFKLYCSESFEQRLCWKAGPHPKQQRDSPDSPNRV
jgi:hypothetical protein